MCQVTERPPSRVTQLSCAVLCVIVLYTVLRLRVSRGSKAVRQVMNVQRWRPARLRLALS